MHKASINDLAIFGGNRSFDTLLHVGKPNIGNQETFMNYVSDIMNRRWLTNAGPMVSELESKLADYLGVKNVIVMCNGTIAMEIAIRAMELKGEVIIPSFTFVACAHAFQWQEIKPVFCDIDPNTHNIDPRKIEEHITPNTSAIMGVHLWGRPCNINALENIAEKHNLKLFFDASHAFACSSFGKKIGSFGKCEIFSFHATKFFNTLEGGAVATNDDELAKKIRLMKNFGFAGYDNVVYVGTNGKMNEISAAMGLTGLQSLNDFIAWNHNNYETYRKELASIPGMKMVLYDEHEQNNFQYIIFEIDENTSGISRDSIVEILHKENILARKYFSPGVHNMQPYKSFFPYSKLFLQETEKLSSRIISLPNGTGISPEEVKQICTLIRFICKIAMK